MPAAKDHAFRKPRYSVTLTASAVRAHHQDTTEHSVQNLSEDGACVQSGEVFQVREKLVVTIGNLMAVGAEVRWVANGLAGMKFTRPINIADALGFAARPPKIPNSSLTRRVPLAVNVNHQHVIVPRHVPRRPSQRLG